MGWTRAVENMKSTIREKRILKAGSPAYQQILPSIAVGGVLGYMVNQILPDAEKYLPLDWIEVTNLSTVDVSIRLDDGDTFYVPHGVIKAIEDKPYRRLRITNEDAVAATGANMVILQLQRLPITQDTYIRRFKMR